MTKHYLYDTLPYCYNIIIKKSTETYVTSCYKSFYFKKRDEIRRINIYGGDSFIKNFQSFFMTTETKDITYFGRQGSANSKVKVLLLLLKLITEQHIRSDLSNRLYSLFELELFK
jgi:hypothetical protein